MNSIDKAIITGAVFFAAVFLIALFMKGCSATVNVNSNTKDSDTQSYSIGYSDMLSDEK